MFIKQEDILSQTRGGLDIILSYYPQAEETLNSSKKQFKVRDERTASATLKQASDGNWLVTDFGGDQVSRNAIQVCMFEETLSFREAIVMLAGRYNVGGLKAELHKPEFKKRQATEDEKEGTYIFSCKEKMSDFELKTLGEKVTDKVVKDFNIYALNSFAYVKERQVIETYANENYPIFLFDHGDFKKIYQPNSLDKAYRFRYSGTKQKDFIFGLKQVISLYNRKNNDPEGVPEKLPEIIIASGERDAFNLYGLGYPVVWFNSETAAIDYDQIKELRKYADNLYLLPDIDTTGKRQALRHGLMHLDLHIIWLPESLRNFKDKRGNPRKDFSDFIELNPKHDHFAKIMRTACPLRFYDIEETDKGIKYQFNNKQMFNFLAANGFYRIENPNEKTGYSIIQLKNNIATAIKPEKIKEFVINYCQENYLPVGVENMIHRTKQLGDSSLISLPSIDIDFTDYTHDSQYMFFENSVWQITGSGIKEYKPIDIDKFVWSDEVLKHKVKLLQPYFKITGNSKDGFHIEITENDSLFFRYLVQTSRVHWRKEIEERTPENERQAYINANYFNIGGPKLSADEIGEQIHNLVNKIFAIGYLLHRYKDKSRAWCVFAMDGKISELGESNGRSGKSITFESMFHLIKHDVIGGRNKMVFDNKHVFENITEHTDLILIDDAHQYLDLDFLFDKITGSMPINPKFNAGYKLAFEKAPKITITSNHALPKIDGSTNDRILFMVYSDWYHSKKDDSDDYNETRKPFDDFGKLLFGHDYTPDDWNADLNFFAQCVQFYLSRQSPEKINPPMNNVTKRNLLASIGKNFNDWANSYFIDEKLDSLISKQQAFDEYRKESNVKDITKNTFSKKLNEWAKMRTYICNPKILQNKDGRIQKNINGTTTDCIYIQSTVEIDELNIILSNSLTSDKSTKTFLY